jgi:hypothetical protein
MGYASSLGRESGTEIRGDPGASLAGGCTVFWSSVYPVYSVYPVRQLRCQVRSMGSGVHGFKSEEKEGTGDGQLRRSDSRRDSGFGLQDSGRKEPRASVLSGLDFAPLRGAVCARFLQ